MLTAAMTGGGSVAPVTPLVVVGSANIDLVLRVPRLPQPGETLSAMDLRLFPGGKASAWRTALGSLCCAGCRARGRGLHTLLRREPTPPPLRRG